MIYPSQNIETIFDETLNLVKNRYEIENLLIQPNKYNSILAIAINDETNLVSKQRLAIWLNFFNENFSKNTRIYSDTVEAIINANIYNEIFQSQSKHELELSFEFYTTINKGLFFIDFCNYWSADYLLQIALIFGKYPGMLVRSLKKGISLLKDGVREKAVQDLFTHLFVKFENPNVFIRNLNHLNAKEIEILFYTLQGNNIRNHPDLKGQLSKKEAAILWLKLGDQFEFTDHVLERAIVYAKLASAANTTAGLFNFCENSRTFKNRLDIYVKDIEFWKSAYCLLSKANRGDFNGVGMYIDYLEYKKYQSDDSFSLKGSTIKSLTRKMNEWHHEASYLITKQQISATWKGMQLGSFEVDFKSDKYLFSEITSGRDLYNESQRMHHCVFSYVDDCITGHSSVWSLLQEQNGEMLNYLTIEIRNKSINQIAGFKNAIPTKTDLVLVKIWADEFGFGVGGFEG